MNVIELRNYLLKPGERDRFIKYFKDHFTKSQNAMGAYTPGQFRIKDEDDRFFWIRGFENMKERSKFLPAFYGGETWNEFGPAANDMMLEWHNVHLLKPVAGSINRFDKKQKLLVIDFYDAADNQLERLIRLFIKTYISPGNKWGMKNVSLWISEVGVNDFPALPVFQNENLLVVMTTYNNDEEYKLINKRSNSVVDLFDKVNVLATNKHRLILFPA